MRQLVRWMFGATAAALLAVSGRGDACGNAVIIANDKTIATVKAAEDALDAGDPARARTLVHSVIGDGYLMPPGKGNTPRQGLINRIHRVLALITVRVDVEARSGEHRTVILNEATQTLHTLLDVDPKSPAKKTD